MKIRFSLWHLQPQSPSASDSINLSISNELGQIKPRVLLIDDEQYIQFQYIVEFYDIFTVQKAPNAKRALEIIKQNHFDYFDAIIFNISTPTGDGLQKIREIIDHMDENIYKLKQRQGVGASQQNYRTKPFDVPNRLLLTLQQSRKMNKLTDASFVYPIIQQRRFPYIIALTADPSIEMAIELSSMNLDFAFRGLNQQNIDMILKNVRIQKSNSLKESQSQCERYLYYNRSTTCYL